MVGVNQAMVVGDHDFTKFSLSPSVSLDVEIPKNMDGAFYDGKVYVGLKENAFQKSTALRHACEPDHVLSEDNKNKPIVITMMGDQITMSVILEHNCRRLLIS